MRAVSWPAGAEAGIIGAMGAIGEKPLHHRPELMRPCGGACGPGAEEKKRERGRLQPGRRATAGPGKPFAQNQQPAAPPFTSS